MYYGLTNYNTWLLLDPISLTLQIMFLVCFFVLYLLFFFFFLKQTAVKIS